jgi:hypothetical protein
MKLAELVARMGKEEVYVLMRKAERKRLLGRPRHRWEDNIKAVLQKMG